jgi:hypothetical protein
MVRMIPVEMPASSKLGGVFCTESSKCQPGDVFFPRQNLMIPARIVITSKC